MLTFRQEGVPVYEIDPTRTDLIDEFRANPDGPHSQELTLVINRLRMMPMHERHVIVCTKRGREWALTKIPQERGAKMQVFEDLVFYDYSEAVWEVFRRRWQTVTGQSLS